MAFYQKIKELRIKAGFSQTEVANKLGLSQRTYSDYELGLYETSFKSLVLIADLFEVSTDYLLGRTNDPNALVWQSENNEKE